MEELQEIRRDAEMDQLWQAYEALQRGKSQLRFITGEAGTGKSVLLNMFLEEVKEKAENTLVASTFCCLPSEYNIPYQPFKELLRQLLEDVEEEKERVRHDRSKKEKLREAFAYTGRMLLEHAPDLIDHFIPGGAVLGAIGQHFFEQAAHKDGEMTSPDETRIIEEYVQTLRAVAGRYRLVLALDDLQWLDKPSVHLLYQLVTLLQDCPILLIGSYRSTDIDIAVEGEKHPLDKLINEIKISFGNVFLRLDTLSEAERMGFMSALLDREANLYQASFRQRLFERTGGNPLFVCELVHLLKEQGMLKQNEAGIWVNNGLPDWQSYPVRIEGIIRERIGRLEDSLLEILSYASVQGYRFIAQVLSRTMGQAERDLLITLSRKLQKQYHLVNEGNCMRSSQGIVSEFNFSNYIFQQYLYQELSATQRMILHGDIAAILEELFKDRIEEVAGDIARHYELAGEPAKALTYLEMTVDQMMSVSAYHEASALITKAMDMLIGEKEEKMKLRFLVKQSLCMRAIWGWTHPETEKAYLEAQALSEQLQCYDYIHPVLFGLWTIRLTRLELDECLKLSASYLATAREQNNVRMEQTAYITYANIYFWMGRFREAEEVLAAYRRLQPESGPKIIAHASTNDLLHDMFALLVAFQMGNYKQVEQRKEQIRRKIESTQDRFCQAIGLQALAWEEYLAEDTDALGKDARRLLQLSEQNGFSSYASIGKMFLGGYVARSNREEGVALIQQGYRELLADNRLEITVMYSVYGLLLCQVYLEARQYAELEQCMNTVMAFSKERKELCYLGEFYILQGRYYLTLGKVEEAQAAFQQALQLAEENGAQHVVALVNKFYVSI